MSADGAPGSVSAASSAAPPPSSGPHQHVDHQHTQSQPQSTGHQAISTHQAPPINTTARLSVHDIRNSDLVSRLLAATPPYLYSSAVGPQNFFFSDMLRSLVQSKHVEAANRCAAASAAANCSQQPGSSAAAAAAASASLGAHHPSSVGTATAGSRRPRKRTWGQTRTSNTSLASGLAGGLMDIGQKVVNINNNIEMSDNKLPLYENKPLELTNKCGGSPPYKYVAHHADMPSEKMMRNHNQHSNKLPPVADAASNNFDATGILNNNNNNTITSTDHPLGLVASSSSTGDLVLPPPPPMWYPPLYPPYGIDPLHFFIDLRVSGHIYDRKKENTSPNSSAAVVSTDRQSQSSAMSAAMQPLRNDVCDVSAARPRFGSAFSVPQSRREKSPNSRALNLTASPTQAVASPDNSSKQHASSDSAAVTTAATAQYTHHTTYDHTLMDAAKNNTNYVLQNLPRIYTDVGAQMSTSANADGRNSSNSDETTDSKSDADAHEMQQLQSGGDGGGMGRLDDERDDHDDDSGDVVIVDGKHHSIY